MYQNIYFSFGAPGKIRTPNLLIRSQTIYPVDLRALLLLLTNNTDKLRFLQKTVACENYNIVKIF